jgi:hypothetical protein
MSEDDADIQWIIYLFDLVERRNAAPRIERDSWIAAARRLFTPGRREPCCVCGRFRGIAQAHHVVPLTTQYDRGFEYPDNEFVWLCPNHHAIIHLFILGDDRSVAPAAMRARARTADPIYDDLSDVEFEVVIDLMRRAARGPE